MIIALLMYMLLIYKQKKQKNKNKGFIRSRLAKSVDLYKIPDLIFVADTLYDQGAKIDNIINSWKK